jgi:hypothetical protein
MEVERESRAVCWLSALVYGFATFLGAGFGAMAIGGPHPSISLYFVAFLLVGLPLAGLLLSLVATAKPIPVWFLFVPAAAVVLLIAVTSIIPDRQRVAEFNAEEKEWSASEVYICGNGMKFRISEDHYSKGKILESRWVRGRTVNSTFWGYLDGTHLSTLGPPPTSLATTIGDESCKNGEGSSLPRAVLSFGANTTKR